MSLALLQRHAADVAFGAVGLALLATSSTSLASPCDALRRALSAQQAAKFSLSEQPCQAPVTAPGAAPSSGAVGTNRETQSLELGAAETAALIDRPATDSLKSILPVDSNNYRYELRRSSQLNIYEISQPSVTVVTPSAKTLTPVRRNESAQRNTSSPLIRASLQQSASAAAKAVPAAALRALALSPDVDAVAQRHDIDPLLLHAIAYVESRHNAAAVSHAGAMGLMQVMPATARRFGVMLAASLQDAPINLDVSASYLKTLQRRFGNDLVLILAAYNAGEGAVERHGRRVPPYAETRNYVREVMSRYTALRAVSRSIAATPRPTL